MLRRLILPAIAIAVVLLLAGCGSWFMEIDNSRDTWRRTLEEQCLRSDIVKTSDTIVPMKRVKDGATCGLYHPYKVIALFDGTVGFKKPRMLSCMMIPRMEAWIRDTVEPLAFATYGTSVSEIETFGSYSCRRVDGKSTGKMSEHAFANAIDVSAFLLADGRRISVKSGWRGNPTDAAFLRGLHDGACKDFSTVIGPDGDGYHQNHFHLDAKYYPKLHDFHYCH